MASNGAPVSACRRIGLASNAVNCQQRCEAEGSEEKERRL
jgi:hypothetical protein